MRLTPVVGPLLACAALAAEDTALEDPAGWAVVPTTIGWAGWDGATARSLADLGPWPGGMTGDPVPAMAWLAEAGLRPPLGPGPDPRLAAALAATPGDDAANAWILGRMLPEVADALLATALADRRPAPPAPLDVTPDAVPGPAPAARIPAGTGTAAAIAILRAHAALVRAWAAQDAGDEAAARAWHGVHTGLAGAGAADTGLPGVWAWPAQPEPDAPLAERLAAWDPERPLALIGAGDRDGIAALLEDPRPSRWCDRAQGGAPRRMGDQALRALTHLLGVDPRLPAGIDPAAPWDDAQRARAVAGVRAFLADPGAGLAMAAERMDPSFLANAADGLGPAEQAALVARLAARGWAGVQDPVAVGRLIGLAPAASRAALAAALPATVPGLAAVTAAAADLAGAPGAADALVALLADPAAADRHAEALALACTLPSPGRSAVLRAAVAGPARRQALAMLLDPGPVAVALPMLAGDGGGPLQERAATMRRAVAVLLALDGEPLPAGALAAADGTWTWDGLAVAVTPRPLPATASARTVLAAALAEQPGLLGLAEAPAGEDGEALRQALLGVADDGALRRLDLDWPELGEAF
jgi:hypothetical protein